MKSTTKRHRRAGARRRRAPKQPTHRATPIPTLDDRAFLDVAELFDLGVQLDVLVQQLVKYGVANEGDQKPVEDAHLVIASAIMGGINFYIESEGSCSFEEWEQRRGTFGEPGRHPDDADLALDASERRRRRQTAVESDGGR